MKIIIETFTSIFFIAVISVLLVSMIGSYISVNNARNYHANIIDRLENSGYESEVIAEIEQEAENAGYLVTIENASARFNRDCYYVKLEYQSKINTFKMFGDMFTYEGVIEGYAA